MSVSFNFSKATKPRDVAFWPGSLRVEWITLTLQVVTRKGRNLGRISVIVPYFLAQLSVNEGLRQAAGEGALEGVTDLDRTLAHPRESFSIRVDVILKRGRLEGHWGITLDSCFLRRQPEG